MNSERNGLARPALLEPKFLWALLWVSVALVAAFPVIGGIAYALNGPMGLAAAAVAGGICWLAGCIALVLSASMQGPTMAVQGVLAGTLFRLMIPMFCGFALHQAGGPLADAGVFGLIVGYYLWTLVVETVVSLRLVQHGQKTAKAS